MSKATRDKGAVTKFVGDVFSTEKKIGDLNGKWAVMLKVVVLSSTVLLPVILTWAVWVTTSIFAAQHHQTDTDSFRSRIVEIEKILTVTPEQIHHNTETLDTIQQDVKESTAENSKDHSGIMVELGKIQTKLEMLN